MTTIGVFANIFDEHRRILCVKRAYGPLSWTTPGGRLETGESPTQALIREVREETGYAVQPGRLVGVYSRPDRDDLVLSIDAQIIDRGRWEPNHEIAELQFFAQDDLPQPMSPITLTWILDAFEGKSGIIYVRQNPPG